MKSIALITLFLSSFVFTFFAQIQPESVDMKVPQISSRHMLGGSGSDPLIIVKIDSADYELDSLSVQGIDPEWIQSVSVFKDAATIKKYGDRGNSRVVIIRLWDDQIVHFIKRQTPDSTLKIQLVE